MLSKKFSFKSMGFQGFFSLIFVFPLIVLFLSFLSQPETVDVDSSLFAEALVNTGLLAFFVLLISGLFGVGFSLIHLLYHYPFKKILNLMMIMPLTFPPYVLAFIYLGVLGPGSSFLNEDFFQVQGELWFLVLVLVFSLTPYVYLFCSLGLERVDQSLLETEHILRGGPWSFFKTVMFPQIRPYLLSAFMLILFESLAEFGAASVINVSVITTMIYRLWFDLFSFSGAVGLCLKYSLIVFVFLFLEFLFKRNNQRTDGKCQRGIISTRPGIFLQWVITIVSFVYIGLSFLLPLFQLCFWSLTEARWPEVLESLKHSLFIGISVASVSVFISALLGFGFRTRGQKFENYLPLTNIGYSLPGTLLAVSAYALLLFLFEEVSYGLMITALIITLCYKFFTVSFRPVAASVEDMPGELDEVSDLFAVSFFRRVTLCFLPEIKSAMILGFFLVMIEVIREMPLTLMLTPGDYQTLSTQIFNLTSEGQWGQASLPGLFLVMIGLVSVTGIHRWTK